MAINKARIIRSAAVLATLCIIVPVFLDNETLVTSSLVAFLLVLTLIRKSESRRIVMKKIFVFCTMVYVATNFGTAYAADILPVDVNDSSAPTPFTHIFENTGNMFLGYNSLFHIAGIAATYGIIKTDIDRRVHNHFVSNKDRYAVFEPALFIGYIAPVVVGGALFAKGWASDDMTTYRAGCAVLQSMIIAVSYSTLLKVFTGRPNPDAYEYSKETDRSREFNWGFMRNGVHYGWPSGHMITTTAIISTLMSYYESPFVGIAGLIVWGYMAVGITSHEGNTAHWFSDVVAGSLMGYAIGRTVGKDFRMAGSVPDTGISVSPVLNPGNPGVVVTVSF